MYSGRTSSQRDCSKYGIAPTAATRLRAKRGEGRDADHRREEDDAVGPRQRGVARATSRRVLDRERAAVRVAGEDEGRLRADAAAHVPRARARTAARQSSQRAWSAPPGTVPWPGHPQAERVVALAPQHLGVGLDAVRARRSGRGRAARRPRISPSARARRCGSSSSGTAPG